jgi:hypothetical protein
MRFGCSRAAVFRPPRLELSRDRPRPSRENARCSYIAPERVRDSWENILSPRPALRGRLSNTGCWLHRLARGLQFQRPENAPRKRLLRGAPGPLLQRAGHRKYGEISGRPRLEGRGAPLCVGSGPGRSAGRRPTRWAVSDSGAVGEETALCWPPRGAALGGAAVCRRCAPVWERRVLGIGCWP